MRVPNDQSIKIVMIGAGGTGSHIAAHLYRMLSFLDRPARLILVDGDSVEDKNLIRQNFCQDDLGRNKAEVISTRYASVFGLLAEFIPQYVEDEKILLELLEPQLNNDRFINGTRTHSYAPEQVILIGAVDNHRSRQMCHRAFLQAADLIYIDSGNGQHTGQVVCGIRKNGRTIQKPAASVYPEILKEESKFPSELSCAEASVSDPQSIMANVAAAYVVANYIYNIAVNGRITARQVTFSTNHISIRPQLRKK